MGKTAYDGIFLAPESIVVFPGVSASDLSRCAGSVHSLAGGEIQAEADAPASRHFED
jgi:hypothetical protein